MRKKTRNIDTTTQITQKQIKSNKKHRAKRCFYFWRFWKDVKVFLKNSKVNI